MPKRKNKGPSKREARAVSRRERKAGSYIKPGDPEFRDLCAQLSVQGLTLKDVPGDGNCLFRALAEQLEDHHSNLRQRAVQHICAHSADYAPFLDEDTAFESYVDEMSKDGTFAGNDAIVAVSRSCAVNIVIHQLGAPRWEVRAPTPAHNTLHIAYLRGEHYCSVQTLSPGHALPQVEARRQQEPTTQAAKLGHPGRRVSDVERILEATGCQDWELAEQCYGESGGLVDHAIVELLQLMALMELSGDVQLVGGEQPQLRPSKPTARAHAPLAGKTPTVHMSNRERKEAAKRHTATEAERKEAAKKHTATEAERKEAAKKHTATEAERKEAAKRHMATEAERKEAARKHTATEAEKKEAARKHMAKETEKERIKESKATDPVGATAI